MIASFKSLLRRTAKDLAVVLREFETPPEFDLWHNPVVASASRFDSLSGASRSLEASFLHDASGAPELCDDGCTLVDGGTTVSGRIWLLYRYHSLTNFDGNDRYTTVTVLRSAVFSGANKITLLVCHRWKLERTLSRLDFDHDEDWIAKNVLSGSHWGTVHKLVQTC